MKGRPNKLQQQNNEKKIGGEQLPPKLLQHATNFLEISIIEIKMYKISIKKNRVKVISQSPYQVIRVKTNWEPWATIENPGELHYELSWMLDKCVINAYKIERTSMPSD